MLRPARPRPRNGGVAGDRASWRTEAWELTESSAPESRSRLGWPTAAPVETTRLIAALNDKLALLTSRFDAFKSSESERPYSAEEERPPHY